MTARRIFTVLDSVPIPMRDGTLLQADVWLPDESGAWPVLLQRTPYRREEVSVTQRIAALEIQAALRRGIVVVVQDTRGRFSSSGDFNPFVDEAWDGHDSVAWLRTQSFCDGRIVMYGASYSGVTQVLAASENPTGLLAISPHMATARQGETWMYRGGALELGFVFLWLLQSLGPEDLRRRQSMMKSQTAARASELLMELRSDPWRAFERLPLIDESLRELAPYLSVWLEPDRAAASAADSHTLTRLAASSPAMLVSGGWNDIFVEGSIELFELAIRRWTAGAPVRDRLILGPWSHGNPSDWQGDEWLGYGAGSFELGAEQLAFFDDALNQRIPATPLVRYFRSGSNTWHAADAWPLKDTEPLTLYLGGRNLSLSRTPPASRWSHSYLSHPGNTVPTVGGATFLPGLLVGRNSGPKDQSVIESRDDVLVFTSTPLDADTEITGLVEAYLWVASSAPTCDWTVKLCEVDANGRSLSRVDGILRWTNPAEGVGAEPVEVRVRLGHLSHLFRKGHRLRLQVASSNFPRFDRNPQSDCWPPLATRADLRAARQTIHVRPGKSSRVVIPVVRTPSVGAASLSGAKLA
jgi:putative CocE/NonD family hydrolase